MKLIRLLAVALLAAVGGGQAARGHEDHAAIPSSGVVLQGDQLLISSAAMKAIEIQTETIKLGDIRHTLRVNAQVHLPPSGQAKVTTLTSGKIKSIQVKPGQQVQAGQELARVESLQLETLQAELLEAAAQMQLLERLVTQREPLVASGGIAGKVLLETKSELQQKQAQYHIALLKLRALGLDDDILDEIRRSGQTVDSIPVHSPIAGTIESIDTRPGQLVEATDHLLDIVDLSTLYVIGDVLESDSHEIQADLPVTITFADLPEHEFVGRINHVRMKMDMTRRLVQAVVTVENRQGLLRPGMFGRMAIEVAAAKQQILCPTSALVDSPRGTMVLRRETEGRFSRQPIEMGMRSPTLVVIQSGLFPGQQVITRGTHLLMAMFPRAADPIGPSDGGDPMSGATTSHSAQASPSPVEQILAAKATVELPTGQKTLATSLIEGRVARIFASVGQLVQPGEVLAEIESQELRNLQLELLQAASKRRWTQGKVDRLGPLAAAGATSTRELWQNELDLKTLSQQVASLQRRLTLLGLSDQEVEQLERGQLTISPGNSGLAGRLAIRSPIAGRVADIGLTLGQIVHAHDSLFEIQNTDTVWIKAMVLENAAARIEPGQVAVVTFPSHPNLRVTGTVVRIAPQLVSHERVLPFWIELPNPQGFLRDGMLARVQISVPKQPATAAVRTVPAK